VAFLVGIAAVPLARGEDLASALQAAVQAFQRR
jgi:hypothetical protein